MRLIVNKAIGIVMEIEEATAEIERENGRVGVPLQVFGIIVREFIEMFCMNLWYIQQKRQLDGRD